MLKSMAGLRPADSRGRLSLRVPPQPAGSRAEGYQGHNDPETVRLPTG